MSLIFREYFLRIYKPNIQDIYYYFLLLYQDFQHERTRSTCHPYLQHSSAQQRGFKKTIRINPR